LDLIQKCPKCELISYIDKTDLQKAVLCTSVSFGFDHLPLFDSGLGGWFQTLFDILIQIGKAGLSWTRGATKFEVRCHLVKCSGKKQIVTQPDPMSLLCSGAQTDCGILNMITFTKGFFFILYNLHFQKLCSKICSPVYQPCETKVKGLEQKELGRLFVWIVCFAVGCRGYNERFNPNSCLKLFVF